VEMERFFDQTARWTLDGGTKAGQKNGNWALYVSRRRRRKRSRGAVVDWLRPLASHTFFEDPN
jgi:hypothetical protein